MENYTVIRVKNETHKRFKKVAVLKGENMQDLATRIIEEYLEKNFNKINEFNQVGNNK